VFQKREHPKICTQFYKWDDDDDELDEDEDDDDDDDDSPAWDTPKSRGKNGKNQGFLMRANFVSHSAIPQTSANASITGPASQNALLWAAPPS
jgi:hypothetical protein